MIQQVGSNNSQPQNKPKSKPKDIYSDTPIRLLGFTNEVGAAISPIVGPVGELATYAPALGYIALDTHDKYRRGDDDSYQSPSHKRATTQLVFQMMASVIFPTAAVKASQAIASKVVDSKHFEDTKNAISAYVQKNEQLQKFLQKFADKQPSGAKPSKLVKFAHDFEKVLNHITVAPLFFKPKENKTGLRNVGLALVGLSTLALVIKPIDKIAEHLIHNAVKPAVDSTL